MPAKLLNAFAYDDHPDLHRQIGCLSGLLHVFDRRHLLSGWQKRLPSESHEHMILEKNHSRSISENQRTSVESSRPSFSSSSGCSSFTSLECNKSTQHEEFTCPETNFQETSSRNFQPNVDHKADCLYMPECASSRRVGHQSLDFRDVVRDSIHRENYVVSNKSIGEAKKKVLRRGDSPRPISLSKLKDGTSVVEKNGKSGISMNIDKSLGLLASSNQPRRLFAEEKGPHRSSYGTKQDSCFSKESPRFSCDSYVKSATNINDLPRLSLDSKERTMKYSNFKALDINHADKRISRDFTSNHGFTGERSPSNVVAKLMGLETSCALPEHQLKRSTSCIDVFEDQRNDNFFSNSPKFDRGKKQNRSFPQSSSKCKPTMQRQTTDSRVPIEPTPWMRRDIECFSQPSKSGCRDTPSRQRHESVCCEIDKKLEQLELLQSNKDFRTVKQILDAIRSKRMSETKKSKEQQQSFGREKRFDFHRPISYEKSKSEDCQHISSTESPIVIMKPARSVRKSSSLPPAIIPLGGLAALRKDQTSDSTDNKKTSFSNQTAKDSTPIGSPKAYVDHLHSSKTSRVKANSEGQDKQRLQDSSSPRPPSSESSGNHLKSSSSSSPRAQQRKFELEKKCRSLVSSSSAESSKPRRLSKQSSESVSPRGQPRCKPKHINKTEVSYKSRHLSHQNDEMPTSSDISLASHVDSDVNGTDQSTKLRSSPGRGSNDKESINSLASINETKKSLVKLRENGSSSKLDVINSEHPSPISILDASIYKDDSPSSPENEITCSIKGAAGGVDGPPLGVLEIDPGTRIKHKQLRNIDVLVQKLGQLTLSEEEAVAAGHHAQDPNHRYVSDVLLASGLLFRNFRLPHHSGHAISPDLFLVLEERRADPAKSKSICDRGDPDPGPDQLHRKLVFDTVDEILTQKLEEPGGPGPRRMLSGGRMLQELCSEIDQLRGDSLKVGGWSDRDSLKTVLGRDVLRQTGQWNYVGDEIPGMVLDVERSIFKDLVQEIINVEPVANLLNAKSSRRRRQLLFAK